MCERAGVATNLTTTYSLAALRADPQAALVGAALLPLSASPEAMPATPLRRLVELGRSLGLTRLFLKDESCGLTWSHKDRLAMIAVAHAAENGRPVVIVSSSGNHGAAVAAACSAQGLACVVLTVRNITKPLRRLIDGVGAHLIALEQPELRWSLMAAAVAELGWYPASNFIDPPIGSNPYGIDGYKLIAWELLCQLGQAPDWVVAPTGYGDLLSGVGKGFRELVELGLIEKPPRLLAAVTSRSLPNALAAETDQPAFATNEAPEALSIGVTRSTFQALHAVRSSSGDAVVVSDSDAARAQGLLATRSGSLLERSSATALAAVEAAVRGGLLNATDAIVVIGTSTGLKDQDSLLESTALPVIDPTLSGLEGVLGSLTKLEGG